MPEPSRQHRSIRQKLLRSFFIVGAIAVALLVVSLLTNIGQRGSVTRLGKVRGPAVWESGRIVSSVQRSVAAVRGWVVRGDARFREDRQAAWQEIDSSINRLEPLVQGSGDSEQKQRLDDARHHLKELRYWQWWIEDVAGAPGNEPARLMYEQDVRPLADRLLELITAMIDVRRDATDQSTAPALGAMADFRFHFAAAQGLVADYIDTENPQAKSVFHQRLATCDNRLQSLRGVGDRLSVTDQEILTTLGRQFSAYRQRADEAIATREQAQWDRARYWLETKLDPLTRETTADLAAISERQNALMRIESQRMLAISDAVTAVSVLLIATMTALAYFVSRKSAEEITTPIETLSHAARDLAEGRLQEDIVVEADNEIGRLTDDFNHMRRSLAATREELVRHQENLLTALVDNIPDAIYFKDRDSRFIRVNQGGMRLLGVESPEAVYGKSDADFFSPSEASEYLADERRIMDTGQPIINKEERETWPDGRQHTVLTTKMPLRDESGQIVGTFGVSRDITELKAAEEEFRSVVEASAAGMVLVDQEGRIVLVNTEVENLFGYSRDELLGKPVETLLPERFRGHHVSLRGDYVRDAQRRRMHTGRDLLGMRKDGTEIYVEIGLTPLITQRGNFVLASLMDVTALKEYEAGLRRANEELHRSNEDLESFAYVASHDLRTPLRNIEILAEWIVEDAGDALPPECMKNLDLMRQRVESMDQLLNDLLQYARVGRKESATERVETDAVVAEVIELINAPARFTIDVAGNLPVLTAPRMAIQTVFQNLIENAVKHHNRDNGHVEISCRENGDFFEFSIRDDGPGIDPRFHDRIFKMFQTLRSRDDGGGSGMGLAIVKKLVENFGGSVSLDSAPSAGACFRFTWRKP